MRGAGGNCWTLVSAMGLGGAVVTGCVERN